ncbi:MAG: hypothetical protein ACREF9_09735 [Opitutaceae bacterium]
MLALIPAGLATAAAPVLIQNAPGRFEIAAVNPTIAHAVATAAEEGWRLLAPPLGLPDGFSSPIFVRIVSAGEMAPDQAPFRVMVEVGGIVSARLRADDATVGVMRRALVQALLMRLAVARHGVNPRLTVPLWLEHGCVGWWETRVMASQLDALKQISAVERPPPIELLLGWQRGGVESRDRSTASIWLFTFLHSESGRAGEWPSLLSRLLNGDDPLIAVTSSYAGRYSSAAERELWWQTGYHHLRRVHTLPALEAAESREQLGVLRRFVFADPAGEGDMVVPLSIVLARANEPVVAAELARRAAELPKLISSLHSFYRNAGLSLNEAFAARTLPPAKRAAAAAVFEQDWRDATELETATRSALDALEDGSR